MFFYLFFSLETLQLEFKQTTTNSQWTFSFENISPFVDYTTHRELKLFFISTATKERAFMNIRDISVTHTT